MTSTPDPPDIASSSAAQTAPGPRPNTASGSTDPSNVRRDASVNQAQAAPVTSHSSSNASANIGAGPSQDIDKAGAKPGDAPPPPFGPPQPASWPQQHSSSASRDDPILLGPASRDDSMNNVVEKKNPDGSDDVQDNLPGASSPQTPSRIQRIIAETRRSTWLIITHTWLNALLVFIPVGIIAAEVPGVHGGVVFAMNCIAIIPLAGLLAFATESVAAKMGDALGALLNVTFGNAVELIIFVIALAQNKIRIVQASLLGSILANLLLILGMGFFLGGLRYREQIYNSTVTQMSACLLSLSVISLVLPTAFHASFSDPHKADEESLKISRGTSVILLLVYGIYLLFQLKSHAYLYESTPQHIVDAESTPGPAAGWLDSSSSDDSSSSSSSDSSDSDHSRDTMKRRMKKVLRGGRKRKDSVASVDTTKMKFARNRSSSFLSVDENAVVDEQGSVASSPGQRALQTGDGHYDAADDEGSYKKRRRFSRRKHKKRKHRRSPETDAADVPGQSNGINAETTTPKHNGDGEPKRVDFAPAPQDASHETDVGGGQSAPGGRRPFPALRGMSVKNLAPAVFVQNPEGRNVDPASAQSGSVPRVRYGIRRTNSLPDRLNQQYQIRPPGAMLPAQIPLMALTGGTGAQEAAGDEAENFLLTKWASIVLLLVSTGLVAFCAELLVSSIEDVTSSSSVGEIFIGLIILPIVGNAAEHVTAITVAMKNKMDLAIGVAVGSSIQIAIFVTPLVVILGWIMDKEMTLYFTLFETVCLFVSAFMVNFLVLDGRSNYLEGALLCAVYLIIAVVAFFYPDADEASQWGD